MPVVGTHIGLSIATGAADLRLDPYRANNFVVEIEGLLAGGFSDCTGLQAEIKGHEYHEGGVNTYVHRFAGHTQHPPLVFKHGMSPIDGLWNWHQDTANGKIKRRNGTIFLLNQQRLPVMWWDFRDGLPLKWLGPALHAAAGAVAFESLEIVHHGLSRPRLANAQDEIAAELSTSINLPGGFF
jgi:phage tail-like protein